ncbi:MAG: LLM class flavin-dependent oxidoreductase [Acidimicrobiales bacterium]
MTKYGLLLPHFGEHATRDNILAGSKRAEELGFDSLWVRDHLVFEPHGGLEKPVRTFYEALTTLTAVGAVTSHIGLGTGSLIPFRHPIVTALMISTITQFTGPRLTVGMGAGTFDHEFEAVGLGGADRVALVRANAEILRNLSTGVDVSYEGKYFSFHDVTIEPRPVGGPVPFWYCGATPRSARLAVDFADGWMPGRISLATLKDRVSLMDRLSVQKGRARPTVAVIPPTSVGATRQEALQDVNVPGLLAWANKAKFTVKPASGHFDNVEDLEGQLIAGSPEEVATECRKFEQVGVEHLVFDVRFKFDRWFEQIELLGSHVLPKLRQQR